MRAEVVAMLGKCERARTWVEEALKVKVMWWWGRESKSRGGDARHYVLPV